MMFNAVLNDAFSIMPAVWMMLTAIGLLVGLGLYVYLGARTEVLLLNNRATAK